jgi:phosphatidylethanolamine/phosphatidyl-N-methylethanolamine N-methyltransferase
MVGTDSPATPNSTTPAAVLSSLPLLTKPPRTRVNLLLDAHEMMAPGSPFVQFTYGMAPPIPSRTHGCIVTSSDWIWLNIPPARVWVYRRETGEAGAVRGRNSG